MRSKRRELFISNKVAVNTCCYSLMDHLYMYLKELLTSLKCVEVTTADRPADFIRCYYVEEWPSKSLLKYLKRIKYHCLALFGKERILYECIAVFLKVIKQVKVAPPSLSRSFDRHLGRLWPVWTFGQVSFAAATYTNRHKSHI